MILYPVTAPADLTATTEQTLELRDFQVNTDPDAPRARIVTDLPSLALGLLGFTWSLKLKTGGTLVTG